jgi:hypothetical protein
MIHLQVEEFFHLVLHEVLHIFSKLLHLISNTLGTRLDISDNDSDFLNVWNLKDLLLDLNNALGLITALVDDISEV